MMAMVTAALTTTAWHLEMNLLHCCTNMFHSHHNDATATTHTEDARIVTAESGKTMDADRKKIIIMG